MKDFTRMNELAIWAIKVSQRHNNVDVTIHGNNEGMIIIVTVGNKEFHISQSEFDMCKHNFETRSCRIQFKISICKELQY
jgi:hypothetical protein